MKDSNFYSINSEEDAERFEWEVYRRECNKRNHHYGEHCFFTNPNGRRDIPAFKKINSVIASRGFEATQFEWDVYRRKCNKINHRFGQNCFFTSNYKDELLESLTDLNKAIVSIGKK